MIRKHLTLGNFIFILAIGLLLYKPTRFKIQGWVTQIIGSPSVQEGGRVLKPSEMNFECYGLDGDTINLLDYRGKPMFVNFWATWCGPCMAEIPSIEKLIDSYKGDAPIVLISQEKKSVLDAFQKKRGRKLPIYYSTKVPSFVTSNSIPLTYIISSKGEILIEKSGAADWDDQSIVDLLN